MIAKLKYSLITLMVSLTTIISVAQQMPTSATVIMNPPHPVYLSDYYAIGSNSFQTILSLNDFNEVSWDVRLKVTIEGEGIKITTKSTYVPSAPITLTAGVPLTFEGSDFASYLDVNNVDLEGISASSLSQSGKLPEGLYQFCVEILDYNSGTALSLTSCATVFIFFEPPPVTLEPFCEDIITPTEPQNVYFTWQIAGGASPTIAMSSLYKLFLYEITDVNDDPYFAVENNHALLIYESDFINQTSLALDFGISTTTLLVAGKKYVYRIRAVDADEKNIYRNDGYSEWCWFFYGYPSDGTIAINTPEDEHVFGKYENKTFGWEVSDLGVPGQQYDYVVTIKELQENQDPEVAMDQNVVWHTEALPTSTSMNGGGFVLQPDFEEGATYVWQVTAFTGNQEVAKSEVYTFYAPSLVDEFYAGNNLVKVITIQGSDLLDISGTAKVQLSDDTDDWVEFDFEHFSISDLNGTMILSSGQTTIDLSDRDPIVLTPQLTENGNANFEPSSATVNSQGVKVKGVIAWQFPHATTDGNIAYVTSDNAQFTLDANYKLNGEVDIDEESTYEILEPYEFKVVLGDQSDFVVTSGEYRLRLKGNIATNENVKTNDGNPYKISFENQPSLYYFEAASLLSSATNYLQPVDDLKFAFMPKEVVIDLSESESPDKLSGLPAWKGLYFPTYQVRFYANETDASNQLSLPNDIDKNESQLNSDFWLTNEGLHLEYDYLLDIEGITFNGFKTEIAGNLSVENNQVSDSKMTGAIKIPVIHRTDEFSFEIPVTDEGLNTGYLNEDLTLRELVFNPYGGENRVDITINRAVFADNERIDLEIDAELAGIGITVEGITDFRVYGDNTIGIGKRNGSKPLDVQVSGEYKGFTAVVQEVGAALYNGNYVFSYITALDMGDDVTGEDGAPLLPISSAEPVGTETEIPTFSPANPNPTPDISVPDDLDTDQSTLTCEQMYVEIDNELVQIEGYLKLTNNDPSWGTSFQGGINGSLKIPSTIEVGSNIIFGDREGTKFWYFDAYFNDTEGTGIAVPPFFNITAMEGRMYHHMSKQESEYLVDPELAFGAALYFQLIDNQTNGTLFAIDAGAEIRVEENGDFVVTMSGDGSFLNANSRTSTAGSLTSAVGEEIANEVMEAIGPVELSFEVGGGTLSVVAENLNSGSMNFEKGDLEFGFGAELSGTPGVSFNFAKGGGSLNFDADASGEFGIGVGLDGNELSLGMSGSNSAYLDLTYGDLTFATAINRANKTGSFDFGYGDKALGFGIGETDGYMNLQLSGDTKFETGFSTEGSAYLGFTVGTNEFSLSGDKNAGSGEIELKVDGLSMNLGANVSEKSGHFGFDAGSVVLDIDAVANKSGSFYLKEGSNEYGIGLDLESGSGNITYAYDGGNKQFRANVENGDEGELFFKNGDTEFGLSGNTAGTAGSLSFKNGDDEFSIAADKDAATGSVSFAYDGNSISSSIASDSGSVEFAINGVDFAAGMSSSGNGGVSYKQGSTEVMLFGNPAGESGSLKVVSGSNEYFGAADLQNDIYNLKVLDGNTLYQLDYSNDAKLVKYKDGDSFEIYASQNASDYVIGTTISGHSITASQASGIASITYSGMGGTVTFNEQYIEFSYNNETLKITENGVTLNGSTLSEVANNAQFDVTKTIGDVDVQLAANTGTYTLGFSKGGNSISVSTAGFEDGSVEVVYNGSTYSVSKAGTTYAVGYNDLSASYDQGTLALQKGSSKSLTISSENVAMTYDNYSFSVSATAFTYSDGENAAAISSDKLELSRGDNSLYVSGDGFGLDIGTTKHLYLTQNSADFKFDNYEASFVNNESLSLTDGTRSLALSNTSLAISDGSRGLELVDHDGVPYVKLTNNDDFFEVGPSGFAVEYDGKRYAINENENLNIEIDDSRSVEFMNNGVKYLEGSTEMIIGGDNNFLEIKNTERSFAVTQDGKIAFQEGDYYASLSKDFEVQYTDGTRTIGLFTETAYLSYVQGDYAFNIRGNGESKPGIDVSAYGYSVFVEGERNSDVTVGVSADDMGTASFSVNSAKDITATFENGSSVYGFIKTSSSLVPITGTMPEDPEPEYLEGSGSVEAMDGPQYLTNPISESAGGRIKGSAEISFNSATGQLLANAAVAGNDPVCIEGAMALDVSPSYFKLDIGTEDQRVEVYPTCTGFGGGGWLGLEATSSNTSIDVGVFAGWQASASIEIGNDIVGAGLSASASAELGVKAKADIYPDFAIKEAGIWIALHADVRAKYWCTGASGSVTIAAVSLEGELTATFGDQTNISGSLDGSINILDIIEKSFGMSFSTNL